MTAQRFIHRLQRLVMYPIGGMNRHSASCPFLPMDMSSMLVHLILSIMDYPVYEKAPKTCRAFLYKCTSKTSLLSWRIDPDDVWKATLPAFISEHQNPSNKDNLSLVDTVMEIPPYWFHHKVHPSVFITAALVPIVETTLVPVPAPSRSHTQGMVQTAAWQLGHVIAKRCILILS